MIAPPPLTNAPSHPSPPGETAHHPHAMDEHSLPTDLPKPRTRTVLAVTGVFVAILIGLFFLGWVPRHRQAIAVRALAEEQAADVPVVGVAFPTPLVASKDLTIPCDIRANQSTDIYPRANGYLKKLYVDIQDHVEAGQLLAEIDTPEVDKQLSAAEATLEQSKAAVNKAQADLKLGRITLQRYTEAQKNSPGSVIQQDVDEKQSAYEDAIASLAQAQANVAVAEANVQQLKVTQGFEKVTAPFAGTITARNYDVGALLNPSNTGPGKQLFSLAQTDTLRVFVSVPQAAATNIRLGQPAFLQVRNYPGREFQGTVVRSAGALDPATRTLSYELHFTNKDHALYAGMYGQARLPVAAGKSILVIPTSALLFNANGLEVGVVQEGKVHIKKVVAGRDLGTEIEITSGLSRDDQIITNPGERMSEGMTVKVGSPGAPPTEKATVAAGKSS